MKSILRNCLIGFLLTVGVIFFVLENQIGGFRAFIVSSGSMEPALSTGSLVITQFSYPHSLQKGDIITFIPPARDRQFVTHRITAVSHKQNLSTFKTKGDNNNDEDLWVLAGGAIVGKVISSVPYLGFVFSFLKSKWGIFLFILLPAGYIIVNEVFSLMGTLQQHKKEKVSQTA